MSPRVRRPLKIIAAIEYATVIARILTHIGLSARAPPQSPPPALRSNPRRPDPKSTLPFRRFIFLSQLPPLARTRVQRPNAQKRGASARRIAQEIPFERKRGLEILIRRLRFTNRRARSARSSQATSCRSLAGHYCSSSSIPRRPMPRAACCTSRWLRPIRCPPSASSGTTSASAAATTSKAP